MSESLLEFYTVLSLFSENLQKTVDFCPTTPKITPSSLMTTSSITFSPPDVNKAIALLKGKADYFPGSAAWTVIRELEAKDAEIAALKKLLKATQELNSHLKQ